MILFRISGIGGTNSCQYTPAAASAINMIIPIGFLKTIITHPTGQKIKNTTLRNITEIDMIGNITLFNTHRDCIPMRMRSRLWITA